MTGLFSPVHLLILFLVCVAIAAIPNISSSLFAQQAGMEGHGAPPAVIVETIQIEEVSDPAKFTARVEAIEAVDMRAGTPRAVRMENLVSDQGEKT